MTRRTFLAAPLVAQGGTVVLLDAETGRVLNGTTAGVLARPGSTLKPFTLLTLLESGRRPGTLVCEGKVAVGDRRFDCTHPVISRTFGAEEALAYSCNSWFTRMALRLDAGALYRRLRGMGFGTEGEVEEVRSAEAVQMQAMGEAGIRVTPLELARAYRKLAVLRKEKELGPLFAGLEGAVRYGTAQAAAVRGVSVAGKTGTGDGAWFAGYAPAEDARVVVVVHLPQGRGGADAAPLAAEVLGTWFARN